jgi:hypothetical protein
MPPIMGVMARCHPCNSLAARTRPADCPVRSHSKRRMPSRNTTLARAPQNPVSAAQNAGQ